MIPFLFFFFFLDHRRYDGDFQKVFSYHRFEKYLYLFSKSTFGKKKRVHNYIFPRIYFGKYPRSLSCLGTSFNIFSGTNLKNNLTFSFLFKIDTRIGEERSFRRISFGRRIGELDDDRKIEWGSRIGLTTNGRRSETIDESRLRFVNPSARN